eukprot:COSAG01_NODE_7457_length_3204_cov_1.858937_1_plen_23_part_10
MEPQLSQENLTRNKKDKKCFESI